MLATNYGESPLAVDLLDFELENQAKLKLWLLIELLVMIAIVGSNIIYLCLRQCRRTQIEITIGDSVDDQMDFIASREIQFVLDIFN